MHHRLQLWTQPAVQGVLRVAACRAQKPAVRSNPAPSPQSAAPDRVHGLMEEPGTLGVEQFVWLAIVRGALATAVLAQES